MPTIIYKDTIKSYIDKLPRFPDGRIDYTGSDTAPVLICFVKCGGEVLLLQRSNKVKTYQGLWNTVAGYLDEDKPLLEKAKEELCEELGLELNLISTFIEGKPYKFTDSDINITWIIFPVMTELKTKPKIKLDWEHNKYQWINLDNLSNFDIVPNLKKSFKQLFQ